MGPHQTTHAQQRALIQSTKSVQVRISNTMLVPTAPVHTHLDAAHMEWLQKISENCKARMEKASSIEGKMDPYVNIVAALKEAFGDGTGTALTEPLRKQLHADRDKGPESAAVKGIAAKGLGLLSPTQSTGRPTVTSAVCKILSPTTPDVVQSLTLPSPSVQAPLASLTRGPVLLSLQMHTANFAPFCRRSRAARRCVLTAPSTTVAATDTKQCCQSEKQLSEDTIPL